jgi:hypothetical protein
VKSSQVKSSQVNMSKFCKVCLDSGKPESIYKSHFIRETKDPNSRVVCPTLLSLECRYCFKKGHTVKYCSILLNKKTIGSIRTAVPVPVQVPVKKAKSSNVYMVLMEEEEEEEKEEEDYNVEYPVLVQKQVKEVQRSHVQSYANVLQRVSPVVIPVVSEVVVDIEEEEYRKRIEYAQRKTIVEPLNWADCDSDSDSDSDW